MTKKKNRDLRLNEKTINNELKNGVLKDTGVKYGKDNIYYEPVEYFPEEVRKIWDKKASKKES